MRIVQTPTVIAMIYEDLISRQIFMDGRPLPKDPNPSFMGYSIGRWDGDTLVVESVGFNDRTWLDFGGHPHTEALKITERIKRTSFGRLDIQVQLDDRALYTRPISVPVHAEFIADTEMLEYVCNENQKDVEHLVGKASDEKKLAVKVAPAILSRYVGRYCVRQPGGPEPDHAIQRHAFRRHAIARHRRQGQTRDDCAQREDVLDDGHPHRLRRGQRAHRSSDLSHRRGRHEGDEREMMTYIWIW